MARLATIAFCLLALQGHAQSSMLAYLKAQLRDGEVHLTWEIRSGNQCNGIDIERSTDGITFIKIGDVQGVCGSQDFAQSYSYSDRSPVINSRNAYRLILGTQEISDTVIVQVIDLSKGLRILPHPASELSAIYLDSDSFSQNNISIFTSNGRKVVREKKYFGNIIPLSTISIPTGYYLVQVKSISGRIWRTTMFWQGSL